jgi:hypothetical protein
MSPDTDKTRETRLRRQAARQGLRLEKSPRRDPSARDFGTYRLADEREGWIVLPNDQASQGYGMSLDDIEAWLNRHDIGEWLNRKAIHMYKCTVLMQPRAYPSVSAEQRQRLTDTVHHQLGSNMVMQADVQWNEQGQALVTLACGGEDASSAARSAEQIVDRYAANNAHIHVQEVQVIKMEMLEGPWD